VGDRVGDVRTEHRYMNDGGRTASGSAGRTWRVGATARAARFTLVFTAAGRGVDVAGRGSIALALGRAEAEPVTTADGRAGDGAGAEPSKSSGAGLAAAGVGSVGAWR
jgi:hypothetical protein